MTALPYELGNVRVYVNNCSAPLLYVCPTQINLLVPGNLKPGPVPLFVVRRGVRGPDAAVTLVPAAPQLFATQDNRVIAQHADYSLITGDAPGLPGEPSSFMPLVWGPPNPIPLRERFPTIRPRLRAASRYRWMECHCRGN